MRLVGFIDNIKKSFKYVKFYLCFLYNFEFNLIFMLDFFLFILEMIV